MKSESKKARREIYGAHCRRCGSGFSTVYPPDISPVLKLRRPDEIDLQHQQEEQEAFSEQEEEGQARWDAASNRWVGKGTVTVEVTLRAGQDEFDPGLGLDPKLHGLCNRCMQDQHDSNRNQKAMQSLVRLAEQWVELVLLNPQR